jgi:Tol biopolymer transport system component
MGEVYRARDPRLQRDVAVKVLPHAFCDDPARLARFEREARLLASLSHPNIAVIYGFEDAAPLRAIVLELLDGTTLSDRIAGGRLAVAEALSIALQVADALDAAHEKSIVHRDLKPANIHLSAGGVVKVLDFGLAKAVAETDLPRSDVATMTSLDTSVGVVLGTVAYMSPEQVRGLPVDKRTDIWAFGCVLYEMLTGRPAFSGSTPSDSIAAILQGEPDWSLLPDTVPRGVQRVVRRCLVKDTKHRFRDIGDVRADLERAFERAREAGRPPDAQRAWRRAVPWLVAVSGFAIAAVLAVRSPTRSTAVGTQVGVTRASITLPAGQELDTSEAASPLALSPDGRRLAYVAKSDGRLQLFVRRLDAFVATPVTNSDSARYPFFSPDGEWVAFFAGGELRRVSVRGGSPVTVCVVPPLGPGATWGPDDTIVFATPSAGLLRVSAKGGTPAPLAKAREGPQGLVWPQFVPSGRALLATAGLSLDAVMGVLSLDTGAWRPLGRGFQARVLPSGDLVYHASADREGEIRAAGFDTSTLALAGTPRPVLDGVFRSENGGGVYFAVADSGTLVFAPGGHARTLVRVDRNGRRTQMLREHRGFRMPRLSPDGRYLSVAVDPRPSQIWVYDLVRGSGFPLSTGGHNVAPLWTPDGRRLAFFSQGDIYSRPADGSGDAIRLLDWDRPQFPGAWTKDGRVLIFTNNHVATRADIWMLPLGGSPRPLIAGMANELAPSLSPDGRWLAYMSDETGRFEVYVRTFPEVTGGKWLISTNGGAHPAWSHDGRELFYVNGTTAMSASVTSRGNAFDAGAPQALFTGPFETGSPQFDVAADGTFVMVEADPNAKPTQIQVVLNWFDELKRASP